MRPAKQTQPAIARKHSYALRACSHLTRHLVIAMALCTAGLPSSYSSQSNNSNETTENGDRGVSKEVDVAEISRKAAVLNSSEWKRAVFELGHWLDAQNLYSPTQVAQIKKRFNERVARMTSYEVQYLLGDLEQKFRVMDSPEARDARAWVGQYLAAVSETKRSDMLKNLPDITTMTATELAEEIREINLKRDELSKRQASFDSSRRELVRSQQQSIAATQHAISDAHRNSNAYSPYRGGGANSGKTPYSDVKTGGGVHVGVGPFGAYVSF